MPGRRVATFGNAPKRNYDYSDRERNVDEEYPAPGGMFDEPAAQNRSHGRGDRSEAGPCADRLAACFLIERGTDDREAAGDEKSGSYTLDTARDDELLKIGGEATCDGSSRKNSHADQEHPPAAKQIAERAAHENQGAQEQSERFDDPLHAYDARVQGGL